MDLFKEISGLTGLPYEDCFKGYRYMVFSGRACYVVRHKGIKRYSREEVVLSLGKELLTVTGKELVLKDITKDEIMIVGEIEGVCTQ